MNAAGAAVEAQRLRVIRLSQSAGLPTRAVLRLVAGDIDTLPGCTDAECLAYLRALLQRNARRAGRVPNGWTQPVQCEGCGPVMLWADAPAVVKACPWCWNRREGLPVPAARAAL